MFNVGDRVVYPMYGAGIVEDMEQKMVEGRNEEYYVIRLPVGNLKIMISVSKAEKLGVREIYDADKALGIIKQTANSSSKMADNWNQRYKENMEKIKTGLLSEVAEVVRNLSIRDKERGLSSIEKKMLNSAKQIIISELILSKDIEKETAEELLYSELF